MTRLDDEGFVKTTKNAGLPIVVLKQCPPTITPRSIILINVRNGGEMRLMLGGITGYLPGHKFKTDLAILTGSVQIGCEFDTSERRNLAVDILDDLMSVLHKQDLEEKTA